MTPTNQEFEQMIERAAERFSEENAEKITNLKEYWTTGDLSRGFSAGASFALQSPELLKEMISEVLEWADENYERSRFKVGKWVARRSDVELVYYTTAELVQLYFTHKQKEG